MEGSVDDYTQDPDQPRVKRDRGSALMELLPSSRALILSAIARDIRDGDSVVGLDGEMSIV